MIDCSSMPTLVLLVLLIGFGVLSVLLIWRWRYSAQEGEQAMQRFRQWRNRRAEETMVQRLKELGWPKVVKQMTAEEVAHQLCNRLADRLWNNPNVR